MEGGGLAHKKFLKLKKKKKFLKLELNEVAG